jgi:protein-tyrosine phosphatase
MKKIMFVCLGNICRSPVGEAVFRHLVEERGLSKKYDCDSSGTSAFHAGADPDPRMGITAEKHGVPMDHSAQQFKKAHYEQFDLIMAMDQSNYKDILAVTQNHKLRTKVHMLREFDPQSADDAEVPDPYYKGGMEAFEEVYEIVHRSCNALLDELEAGKLL